MADNCHQRSAVYGTALILLVLGASLHYGWALFHVEHQADVWNAMGAACRLLFVAVVVYVYRGWTLYPGLWWMAEESLVIGCSTWHILAPWQRLQGEAQCNALLGYDIGKIGALALLAAAVYLHSLVGARENRDA